MTATETTAANVTLAPGNPGIPPRWTSSTKEGVGTAYSVASRVWFTLSHGILNEIYFPTIDRPQTRDMGFLITDGKTFFHEEKRHLHHEIRLIDDNSLGYEIISSDPDGRYRLVKEIICDPHQPCVLLHTRLEADPDIIDTLHVYALLAPHLEVGGANNTGWRMSVASRTVLVANKNSTYLAMGATVPFLRTSSGFVGVNDGWTDLHDNFRLDHAFGRAENGNIALTAELDLSKHTTFTLGIAFGNALHAANTILTHSLAVPYADHRAKYIEQWQRACGKRLPLHEASRDNGFVYRVSQRVLLAHEDKINAGAFIASLSIPWGSAKSDHDTGPYHLVWVRDASQSATAFLAMGDTTTTLRALIFFACSQHEDGGFAQSFWIDGQEHRPGQQLDQVAYPILLSWRLWKLNALQNFDPYPMVRSAARYLVEHAPWTEQERWEENAGYSPSTLAVVIAALICAAAMARRRDEPDIASYFEQSADFLESHIEAWTVATQSDLIDGVREHYIRLLPIDKTDPTPDEDPNTAVIHMANQPPDSDNGHLARRIVDAGFLELVRYGIRKPDTPLMRDSLKVIDALLKVDTPAGPCWRRYNHDGYGERHDGTPFHDYGVGRAWPILTGERGHYELAAGRDPAPYIKAMENFAARGGLISEQIWDTDDIPKKSLFLGQATGAARPLAWSHAEYVTLLRSARDGKVFDLIPEVADRYLNNHGRKDLEVWKLDRQIRSAPLDYTLRIQTCKPFTLRWTDNDWTDSHDTPAADISLGVYFVDIPLKRPNPVQFTFLWTRDNRWQGNNFTVNVNKPEP